MEHPLLKILNPGLLSTFQDSGRTGYLSFGMPPSGAVDKVAFLLANWLVNNPLDSPCIETTLSGPKIEFLQDCYIGITGANTPAFINQKLIKINNSYFLKKGDILKIGTPLQGARNYISIKGTLSLPKWLGSYSTNTRLEENVLIPNKLKKNQMIYGLTALNPAVNQKVPNFILPHYSKNTTVRFTKGPEARFYAPESYKKFTSYQYKVSNYSDRNGLKLIGPEIKAKRKKEMISSGVLRGTIQMPHNGQPIVLLADGPTTGGYNRIGNIITADLHFLGQVKPGDSIRFHQVSFEAAHEMYESFITRLEQLI